MEARAAAGSGSVTRAAQHAVRTRVRLDIKTVRNIYKRFHYFHFHIFSSKRKRYNIIENENENGIGITIISETTIYDRDNINNDRNLMKRYFEKR